MRSKCIFFVCWLSLLLGAIDTQAGTIELSKSLTRAQLVAAPATVALEVSDAYPSSQASYGARLSLRYHREDRSDLATRAAWTYQLTYQLRFYNAAGQQTYTSPSQSLTLSYSTPSSAIFEALAQEKSSETAVASRVQLLVIALTPTGTVPNDIRLELSLLKQTQEDLGSLPQLGFDPTATIPTAYWSFQRGAEAYQLEWVYIDDEDRNPANLNQSLAASLITPQAPFLAREPVRIQTSQQYFELNQTYPKGKLYFRVRGVGMPSSNGSQRYSEWSYGDGSSPAVYTLTGDFEGDKTWQYTVNYAEEGKYKKILGYYDGSMRNRQSLTNLSSERLTLVGETKYDYEGRGTVQILPVPQKNLSLSYRPDLNRFNTTTGKQAYDNSTESAALSPTSEVAKYYSSANDVENLHRNYLPDAEGYPYQQTLFARDGTGRVSKSSGLGKTFRLHSPTDAFDRHFTRYFYGIPTDTELRRLFGTNVGLASHYKKNMVVDPNGQVSVTYLDQAGRTIATALGGAAPSNLQKLASNVAPASMVVSLNQNNVVDPIGLSSRSVTKIQNLAPNQVYIFKYSLDGVLNKASAEFGNLCKGCSYSLKVQLLDPTGKLVQEALKPITPPATPDCNYATYLTSFEATPLLTATLAEIGEYTVIKELMLSDGAIDALLTSLKALPTYPKESTYVATALATMNPNACNLTCEDHCRSQILKEHPSWTSAQIEAEVPNCVKTSCSVNRVADQVAADECASLKQQMLAQLRPGGYYNTLGTWLETNRTGVVFHAKDGTTVHSPQPTREELQNPSSFLEQWALDLLSKHPEYCHYLNCQQDQASVAYDIKMAAIKDWNEAIATGFINPLAMTTAQKFPSITTTPQVDPFFSTGRGAGNTKNNLITKLGNYQTSSGGSVLSLWEFVSQAGLYTVENPQNGESMWRLFRGLYLGEKKKAQTALNESTSCRYLPDAEHVVVQKPLLPESLDEINRKNAENLAQGCLACDEQAKVWLQMLQNQCNITWQNGDDAYIKLNLLNYCTSSCGVNNPFALLLQADIATNVYLQNIQNRLITYPCSLNGIATESNLCKASTKQSVRVVSRETKAFIALYNELIQNNPPPTVGVGASNNLNFEQYYDITTLKAYLEYQDVLAKRFTKLKFYAPVPGCQGAQFCFNTSCYQSSFLISDLLAKGYVIKNVRAFFNLRVNESGNVLCDVLLYSGSMLTLEGNCLMQSYDCPTTTTSLSPNSCSLPSTKTLSITICTKVDSSYSSPFNPAALKAECVARQQAEAQAQGKQAFLEAEQQYVQAYLQQHFNACFKNQKENFYYESKEPYQYHYTLYYYDQSGNLVQTVPPAGVELLATTAFDAKGNYNGTSMPTHRLLTKYKYNSINQLIWQSTPDGGESFFIYDQKGQLRLSQNAKQKAASTASANQFSYTRYDAQGRVTEVGQVDNLPYDVAGYNLATNTATLNDPAFPVGTYALKDITATYYDAPYAASSIPQQNLRNRVSAVLTKPTAVTVENETVYSYDFHGNVSTLAQQVNGLGSRRIDYDYDLLSGKVNEVSYQRGKPDAFQHRYRYDSDNRLRGVKTSTDGLLWQQEAQYFYYKHGPLARLELGQDQVQGLDYYYTLQGWLKGINTPQYHPQIGGKYVNTLDPGKDGVAATGNANTYVGQDEFQMALGYHQGDYKPINATEDLGAAGTNLWTVPGSEAILGPTSKKGLYNGNIALMVTDAKEFGNLMMQANNNGSTRAMAYRYDQLNRLVEAYNYATYQATATWLSRSLVAPLAYDASFGYDPNGNLLSLKRAGTSNSLYDDFTYAYNKDANGKLTNNRLRHVTDAGPASGSTGQDLLTQAADNYGYDAIGNLTKDASQSITAINWSVYGKVKEVQKSGASLVQYTYDGAGNRVRKTIKKGTGDVVTYYVRDASGNVMATYEKEGTNALKLLELPLYGSDRLGLYSPNLTLPATESVTEDYGTYLYVKDHLNVPAYVNKSYKVKEDKVLTLKDGFSTATATNGFYVTFGQVQLAGRELGKRSYELKDHLGNVRIVINDLKLGKDSNADGKADLYTTQIISFTDYGPFGDGLPGRQKVVGTDYRYGFNGKEKDKEMGGGNLSNYDYGFRIYNPAIAKFLSVDPLTISYPELTPYQFASNRPIDGIDLDGLEYVKANLMIINATPVLKINSVNEFTIFGFKYSEATTYEVEYNGNTYKFQSEDPDLAIAWNNISQLKPFITDPEGYKENLVTVGEQVGDVLDAYAAVEFLFPNSPRQMPNASNSHGTKTTVNNKSGNNRRLAGCFIPGTLILTENGFKNIEEIKAGTGTWGTNDTTAQIELRTPEGNEIAVQKKIDKNSEDGIITYSPVSAETKFENIDDEEITPRTWKWIDLELFKENGSLTKISLRRPHWWIKEVGADSVGRKVYINMPELGSQGWATVMAIRANELDTRVWRENRKGDFVSRPITGKFQHESNNLYSLYFGNSREPLGVTGSHPIWSLDRNDWVRAEDVKIGETVKTHAGKVVLKSKKKVAGEQQVYNLEVYKDHNFLVSTDRILVHNNGCGPEFEPVNYKPAFKGDKGATMLNRAIKEVAAGRGKQRFEDDGITPVIFRSRYDTKPELKWHESFEYEVPGAPGFRILKKPDGNNADGTPKFKYGYSPVHYNSNNQYQDPNYIIYDFKLKPPTE